jgi:hypothetical protein
MGEDIETRLAEATARKHAFETATARSQDLARRADQMADEIKRLQAARSDEDRDVRRLEGMSLTRVLASLAGSRDDRLARERAEGEAAAYRVAAAQAQLDAVNRELTGVRAELDRLDSGPADYDAILAEKEAFLKTSTDPRGRRLLDLAAERGTGTGLVRELGEAIAAADTAARALAGLSDTLRSASNWSTYDVLGGGAFSSMVKHSRLDEAAEQAARVDRCLATLRTELADVGAVGPTGLPVDISGTSRFLDVWFDNIFTDMRVADRIAEARANVGTCVRQVEALRTRLRQQADAAGARLDAIERERQNLLTSENTS